MALPVYQKIKSTNHPFEIGQYYSLSTLARILGFSAVGIRQRAINDQWPMLNVWCDKHRMRRPHFVSGEFLSNIQKTAQAEVVA
ncbi:MAG: hypothetical protein ACO23H_17205 [Alphaproteobacteria bacterium]